MIIGWILLAALAVIVIRGVVRYMVITGIDREKSDWTEYNLEHHPHLREQEDARRANRWYRRLFR